MTEPMGERGRQGAAPLGGHTPGPWTAYAIEDPLQGPLQGGYIAVASSALRIADVPSGGANARLIASAPDLLEALEAIAIGEGPFARDPLTHCSNTVEAMKGVARDAISKARGEQ